MAQVALIDVPELVAHCERFLGPITSGWMKEPGGDPLPFQVVRYSRGPDVGSIAYSTLGLSRRSFASPEDGTAVRQELVFLSTKSLPVEYVLTVFRDVAARMEEQALALGQGDVLGPVPPPVPGSAMVAVYAAMPVYFDDSFATHVTPSGEVVELVWLVPVTTPEARFVRSHGWEAFEDLLADQDPDLVDVYRAEMVLPEIALPEIGLPEISPA